MDPMHINIIVMAGLDPATQRARVCGRKRVIGSRTLANWMAASEGGHDDVKAKG